MKKSFVSLLCVMLCFLVGMPGFAAKGEGVLPDPAELLGKEGTLYAEDYEFAEDYVCSAYFYETADDDFFNDYLGLAEDSGFDLYRTTVDDCDAFLMQYGGRDALLFPDFEGSMLLLVENGMEFAGAAKNDGPWLPDPCTALNVDGEYNSTSTGDNGATYDFYTYDLTADYNAVAHFIVAYTEALKGMGYTSKKLKQTGQSVWYQQYTYGDIPGAEMAVFVSGDAKVIAEGGESGWQIVLAVPEGYSFVLGNGAPGIVNGNTVCVGCGGSGNCAGCGGTGRANYGDGYETCVICDGNGVCNVCDGEGSY